MAQPTNNCTEVDGTFGPSVGSHCRGGFDFTVTFESSILSVALSTIFLIVILLEYRHVKVRQRQVRLGYLGKIKLVCTAGRESVHLACESTI